jgi:hypothetical protein
VTDLYGINMPHGEPHSVVRFRPQRRPRREDNG